MGEGGHGVGCGGHQGQGHIQAQGVEEAEPCQACGGLQGAQLVQLCADEGPMAGV